MDLRHKFKDFHKLHVAQSLLLLEGINYSLARIAALFSNHPYEAVFSDPLEAITTRNVLNACTFAESLNLMSARIDAALFCALNRILTSGAAVSPGELRTEDGWKLHQKADPARRRRRTSAISHGIG